MVELGMNGRRLAGVLAAQRRHCELRAPTYVDVLGALEDDLADRPPWLAPMEEAWRSRSFAVGWEAAHLLLAELHYYALSGRAMELAEAYPSCGGSGRGAGEAVKGFLRRAPDEFWRRLASAYVQTNEVDRSVAWMLAAAAAFGSRRMPFHFVELGASAGLNLVGDHLPHDCRVVPGEAGAEAPPSWASPHRVLSRTGLDIRPRRLGDPEDRLWLKACVWTDDLERLRRLDGAVETFLRLEAGPAGPRLERCAFADAPAWLSTYRPPKDGEGLLVFNSIATIYLDESGYRKLARGMAAALAPWGGRAFWVEFERARGADDGPLELAVHRPEGGRLATRVLGTGAARPVEMRIKPGWEFLGGAYG
ncbi:MAG: DUF2332 family protein [Elusimicrobia bacterium]|nr:DUF2332 family protein [Elusimicrobiota bacterium]